MAPNIFIALITLENEMVHAKKRQRRGKEEAKKRQR
jgi:hypothetical protein